jgi:peptidoglycan/LPS O-acetylase OafA/YrhL
LNNSPPRFDSLTSIRFVAAVAVYLYHCRHLLQLVPDGDSVNLIHRTLGLGFLGVPFFFTLSGFILCLVYSARMPTGRVEGAGFNLRAFFLARLARVYPMYIASLIPAIPFFFADSKGSPVWAKATAVITTPILLQAWIPSSALLWNPVGWSLSVEAFLYLLFPLLLRRMMGGSSIRPVVIAIATLAMGAFALLAIARIAPETALPGPFAIPASTLQKLARYSPALHLPAFVAGMAAALLFTRRQSAFTAQHGLAFCIVAIASCATAALVSDRIPHLHLHNWLLTPGFALLLVGLAILDTGSHLPNLPWLNLLGEASYSFYLTHLISIRLYSKVVELITGSPASGWTHAFACLLPTTLLSIACHLWLERPMRRVILQWAGQRHHPVGSPKSQQHSAEPRNP